MIIVIVIIVIIIMIIVIIILTIAINDNDNNNVFSFTIKSPPYRMLPFMEVKKMFLFMNWLREEIPQV